MWLVRRGSLILAVAVLASPVAAQTTTRTSVSSAGMQANGASHVARLSDDGRFVVFRSAAINLVPGDTNGAQDVFLRDRVAGTTARVSVGAGGQANGTSDFPDISADGQWVVFASAATNLVAESDTNAAMDIFLRDVPGGVTYRMSVNSSGEQADGVADLPAVSGDGRYVAFRSIATNLVPDDTNNSSDIFVRDRIAGTTVRASVGLGGQALGHSLHLDISSDGRYVAFDSYAGDLVAEPNGALDVFVRDLVLETTVLASKVPDGAPVELVDSGFPSISGDGRYVLFGSLASNLVPGDANGTWDAFVRDLVAGTTTRVDVSSAGAEAAAGVDFGLAMSSISATGRWVTFTSDSNDLVPGDTNGADDVFVHDLVTLTTSRASVSFTGAQANGRSTTPCISADGSAVVFESIASNLVAETDNNSAYDIFVHDVPSPWTDLGSGLAGTHGVPQLVGEGTLAGGASGKLVLTSAKESAACTLLVSLTSSPVPFKGGTLVAFPLLLSVSAATDASGKLFLPFVWPFGVPAGSSFWFQFAIADPAAIHNVSLSNALQATTP